MATHSSILAWKVTWTEEPGRTVHGIAESDQDSHTHTHTHTHPCSGIPGGSSTCNAGDPRLIHGSGKCPGEGNGYQPQHSCLENSMDRGG